MSQQKQLPENIARALYDNYARLDFARQLFLWEVYIGHLLEDDALSKLAQLLQKRTKHYHATLVGFISDQRMLWSLPSGALRTTVDVLFCYKYYTKISHKYLTKTSCQYFMFMFKDVQIRSKNRNTCNISYRVRDNDLLILLMRLWYFWNKYKQIKLLSKCC